MFGNGAGTGTAVTEEDQRVILEGHLREDLGCCVGVAGPMISTGTCAFQNVAATSQAARSTTPVFV